MSDIGKNLERDVRELISIIKEALSSLQKGGERVGDKPKPVQKNVSLIIFNPTVPSENGRKLSEVMKWGDPDELTEKYIADVQEASYGCVTYNVVERIETDTFPAKVDGFVYDADEYVKCVRQGSGFHDPDKVDYKRILEQFEIVEKVNQGKIDEAWLFAFPYAGFYESIMGGPGAFWCNAPPLVGAVASPAPTRRFVIMGFNYERGVGEMLEDLGHRAESILSKVFEGSRGDKNLWERFTRYDKTHPGRAECGNVHFAPNSLSDYDWGSRRKVVSRCDDWLNFPNFQDVERKVDCRD
ncbi:MAG TPA: hypothetical protein VI547_05520, partial [Anaerolineales bacterium]|nr:hypothetical protein [Anaerolineales bacterium]